MVREGFPHMEGGISPLAGYALFLDEVIEVVKDVPSFWLGLVCLFLCVAQGNFEFCFEFFGRGSLLQFQFVLGEVVFYFADSGIYFKASNPFTVSILFTPDFTIIPNLLRNTDTNRCYKLLTLYTERSSNWVLIMFVCSCIQEYFTAISYPPR